MITLGLSQIKVGTASPSGTMPGVMTKIGKTYKDSCKINQDSSDVTEHFEEGMAAPEYRKKTRKMATLTFSLMDADAQMLADYIGGENNNGVWGYNGNELVTNKAIRVETAQGLIFDIPNGDIEAVINADLSAAGIMLIDFTVTPMSVSSGKALSAHAATTELTVDKHSVLFTSAADTTGKVVAATATGTVTATSDSEWCTTTVNNKNVTIKVSANSGTSQRIAVVKIEADDKAANVVVTQDIA